MVSASDGSGSINEEVMEAVGRVITERGLAFEEVRLRGLVGVPILLERGTVPEPVLGLLEEVRGRGTVVLFAPEHNGYFSAFLKNILDWLSVADAGFLGDADVVVVSASTTDRTRRRMEAGALTTMGIFTTGSVRFVNFNGFGGEWRSRMDWLADRIVGDPT